MTLTAVSLFAGIEGIGLALHRAGVEVTAAVEIDDAARGVIADRMPDTTLLTDVTEVSADDLRATGFDPDRGIATAGFPCQDLSVAGRRKGMGEGTRSGLWWHVVRLLAELRPRWFLGENVPGLLSATCPCPGDGTCGADCSLDGDLHAVSGGICEGGCIPTHGGAMGAVLGSLAELGYGYAYRVLDAQHFGVPQRRRRVFIVGRAGDRAAPVQVLLEPEGGGGDSATGRQAGTRVAATLTAGSHGPGSNAPGRRSEDDDNIVVDTLMAGSDGRGWRVGADEAAGNQLVVDALLANGGDGHFNDADANRFAVAETPHVAYALRADPGGTGQGHNTNYVTYEGDPPPDYREPTGDEPECPECRCDWVHHDADGFCAGPCGGNKCHGRQFIREVTHALTAEGADASEDGTGRGTPLIAWQGGSAQDQLLSPDAVSPTLAHSSNAHQGHHQPKVMTDTAVRRLTPLECERLQGFPDGWTATSNGKPQSDSARYRQLGNAVAVPCVEWIAKRIVHADALTRAGP